jgi:hypothetical protein
LVISGVLGAAVGCAGDRGVVTVDMGGGAYFASYRDGNDQWQKPRFVPETGAYELDVANDFEIVAVFVGPGIAFHAREFAGTRQESDHWSFSDPQSWFVSPAGDGSSSLALPGPRDCNNSGPGVAVTGQMVQPGLVSIAPSCERSITPNWSFSIFASSGPHDVIAKSELPPTSALPTVVVQRGVVIDGAATLPTIDLSSSGVVLAATLLSVTGLSSTDRLYAGTTLSTATDTGVIGEMVFASPSSQTLVVPTMPPALLATTDHQQFEVAAAGIGVRFARGELSGDALAIDFPEANIVLFSQIAGTDTVRWAYPLSHRYEVVGLGLEGLNGAESSQEVYATRGWLAARDAITLAFDASAIGFRPEWTVDHTYSYSPIFAAFDYASSIKYQAIAYP